MQRGPTFLMHHGVDGQEWGKRNGPPYPLDKQGKADLRRQKKLAKIERRREKLEEKEFKKNKFPAPSSMSNEDLARANERMALKNEYQRNVNEHMKLLKDYKEIERGKTKTEKFMDKYGQTIVSSTTNTASELTKEIGKSVVSKTLDAAMKGYQYKLDADKNEQQHKYDVDTLYWKSKYKIKDN